MANLAVAGVCVAAIVAVLIIELRWGGRSWADTTETIIAACTGLIATASCTTELVGALS